MEPIGLFAMQKDTEMSLTTLLVEDDMDLAASLIDYLELESINCDHAFNGLHGVELALENAYDVILLDIMVPGLDGLGVCEKLRREGVDTPILMLTARDTLDDKVAGFSAGTDDYLVKPFAMKELLFRIRALAKRRSSQAKIFTVEDLEIDLHAHEVRRGGAVIHLTPTEWELIKELVSKSPEIVSRRSLERALWGDDVPESNSLNVHLHKLRQKIDGSASVQLVHTAPGVGVSLRGGDG
jgi:DNA-binding response OmpR family regulator